MKDIHYTPESLSKRLISYIDKDNINSVVDFCAGNGSLLIAAKERWGHAKFFGADISKDAISFLKNSFNDWEFSLCDFTKKKSRIKSKIIKSNKDGFDLVLLNPPFSCRGGEVNKVFLDNEEFLVSVSMLFIVESLKYLSNKGVLYAILPISVAYSQKDKKIWNKLIRYYNLTILEEPKNNEFKSCSASVILVSINTKSNSKLSLSDKSLDTCFNGISVFRGKISMYTINGEDPDGSPLVHSTNLRNGTLVNLDYKIKNKLSQIEGPAVLLHRVGLPNPQKICVISKDEKYILSDCVIAIKSTSFTQANQIKNALISNWIDFANLYKGTGAKYITIERLKLYLNITESLKALPSLQGTLPKPTKPGLQPNFVKEPYNPSHDNINLPVAKQKIAIK